MKKELNQPLSNFDLNLRIPTVGLESNEILELVQNFYSNCSL